jgi:hypothetical protein
MTLINQVINMRYTTIEVISARVLLYSIDNEKKLAIDN